MVRGGGDLATGVAWRLTRAGWPVVVLELAEPLTVRRTVALSTAVTAGSVDVEGMVGLLVASGAEAVSVARAAAFGAHPAAGRAVPRGAAAVLVAPTLAGALPLRADVVVDARLAKRNLDTRPGDGDFAVGLGPGFTAGVDCHAVVETMRGHRLGRVIWSGPAAADTGVAGVVGGRGVERVLRASSGGVVGWDARIGDIVAEGARLGVVRDEQSAAAPAAARHAGGVAEVTAPFAGVLRGAIRSGTWVTAGLKIGDLDPRCDPSACHEISDKSLAVGGGVLEAVLAWRCGLS